MEQKEKVEGRERGRKEERKKRIERAFINAIASLNHSCEREIITGIAGRLDQFKLFARHGYIISMYSRENDFPRRRYVQNCCILRTQSRSLDMPGGITRIAYSNIPVAVGVSCAPYYSLTVVFVSRCIYMRNAISLCAICSELRRNTRGKTRIAQTLLRATIPFLAVASS